MKLNVKMFFGLWAIFVGVIAGLSAAFLGLKWVAEHSPSWVFGIILVLLMTGLLAGAAAVAEASTGAPNDVC